MVCQLVYGSVPGEDEGLSYEFWIDEDLVIFEAGKNMF
jgi:hypothetical protein